MIFHLGLALKTDLRDRHRRLEYPGGLGEYLFKIRVLLQNGCFHVPDRITADPQILRCSHIAKTIPVVFDAGNATIPVGKMVQSYLVCGPIPGNMIFYTHKIVELVRSLSGECPFPAYIEITSLAKGPADHPGGEIATCSLNSKDLLAEMDVRYACGFEKVYSAAPGDRRQGGVDLIPADAKTAQRKLVL